MLELSFVVADACMQAGHGWPEGAGEVASRVPNHREVGNLRTALARGPCMTAQSGVHANRRQSGCHKLPWIAKLRRLNGCNSWSRCDNPSSTPFARALGPTRVNASLPGAADAPP